MGNALKTALTFASPILVTAATTVIGFATVKVCTHLYGPIEVKIKN